MAAELDKPPVHPKPEPTVQLGVPGVTLTRTGLRLPQRLAPTDWQNIGTALGKINGMSAWAVGDWVNANPATKATIVPEIAELVGLTVVTVNEYARIARKFPPHKRKPNVAWGTHQAVGALPPERADDLLEQAAEHGWSAAAIRLKAGAAPPEPPKPRGTVEVLTTQKQVQLTVRWKDEYADDPDLLATLNTELQRMVENWDMVAKVEIA